MFRASSCPSSGERSLVTACGVYLLVVLDVAGARAATFTVITPYNVAPQYRNLLHPALPANTLHMQ